MYAVITEYISRMLKFNTVQWTQGRRHISWRFCKWKTLTAPGFEPTTVRTNIRTTRDSWERGNILATLLGQNSLKPSVEKWMGSSYLIENSFVQLESDGVGNSSTQLFVDFCRRQLSTTAVVFEVGSTSETDCSTFVRMRKAKWSKKDLGFVADPESQG